MITYNPAGWLDVGTRTTGSSANIRFFSETAIGIGDSARAPAWPQARPRGIYCMAAAIRPSSCASRVHVAARRVSRSWSLR